MNIDRLSRNSSLTAKTMESLVPEHILKQPCSDRDSNCREILLMVAHNTLLSPSMLGRWLFLQECEIQDIQYGSQRMQVNEQRYEILLKWINSNGSAATYEILFDALQKGDNFSIVERVIKKLVPVSLTRLMEETCIKTDQTPVNVKGIRSLPTPGTPATTTPLTPSLSSFPESIQEEASTTPEPFTPINQSSSVIVGPGNIKSSPVDIGSSPTATVFYKSEQESALPSIHHRPVSLNIHKCPAHYHTTAQGNIVSPFNNWPKCSNPLGQSLQQRMNKAFIEQKEKAQITFLKYLQTSDELKSVTEINQSQKEELSRTGAKMREVINDASDVHTENFQLRQELELNQHLLAIVCGTLEVWKDEVQEEKLLAPLQSQIDTLLQSVSLSIPESLLSIQRDYQKLKVERGLLETELNSFLSLYAEKQTQLKAIVAENERLERANEYQREEILQLKQKVHTLMGKCKIISAKNKELEKKVAVLEQEKQELKSKCSELEKNRVVVVLSKPAQADLAIHGLLRSHSDGTYTQQRHPLCKYYSDDRDTNTRMAENLLREVDCIDEPCVNDNEESEHEEQCSLQWLDTVNEMIKTCDEGNDSVLRGCEEIQKRLNDTKINLKLLEYH